MTHFIWKLKHRCLNYKLHKAVPRTAYKGRIARVGRLMAWWKGSTGVIPNSRSMPSCIAIGASMLSRGSAKALLKHDLRREQRNCIFFCNNNECKRTSCSRGERYTPLRKSSTPTVVIASFMISSPMNSLWNPGSRLY